MCSEKGSMQIIRYYGISAETIALKMICLRQLMGKRNGKDIEVSLQLSMFESCDAVKTI